MRLSLDRIFEVDRWWNVKHSCNSFGHKNAWRGDPDYQWDGGNLGADESILTVDGEAREVIRNRFSARLNNCCNRWGGGNNGVLEDAWMNITVYFFIDPRGGTFDLRGTGDAEDFVTPERFTLKYLIDSSNWPFRYWSDKLGMAFSATLIEVDGDYDVLGDECGNYNGGGYGGGYGYGSVSKSSSSSKKWWKDSSSSGHKSSQKKKKKSSKKKKKSSGGYNGNGFKTSHDKGKSKKKKKKKKSWRRRMAERDESATISDNFDSYDPSAFTDLYDQTVEKEKIVGGGNSRQLLGNYWRSNPYGPWDNHYSYGDAWGNYQSTSLSMWSSSVQTSNYAFDIDFRLETVLTARCDHKNYKDEVQTYFSDSTSTRTTVTHYFPRFTTLEFDGAAIFYRPTFEYWKNQNVTSHLVLGGGDGNNNAYTGEDVNSDPQLKTVPTEEKENGLIQKVWALMSEEQWIWLFVAVAAVLFCVCVSCGCWWHKARQNTHENSSSFVKLE